MNKREQFKLMHVKNDLRRIMVLSTMTKFKLANPCQNKESMAAFMLILRRQNQRFETLIQNADPKRRLIQAIVRAQVKPERRLYDVI